MLHARHRLLAAVLAGCLTMAAAACTGDEEPTPDATAPPADEAAETEEEPADAEVAEEETGDDAEPTEDKDATEEPADDDRSEPVAPPSEVLASMVLPVAWMPGAELEMAVNEMTVRGDLLRVVITYTATVPREEDYLPLGSVVGGGSGTGTWVQPVLIDPVNLKAYEVVTGEHMGLDLYPDAPQTVAYYYAVPEDDVEAFDVQLDSALPVLADVPYTP